MPRVLLITAAFPPLTSGPSDQMCKRAKYLARFGWDVDVLTPEIAAGATINPEPPELPDAVKVHRTGFLMQSFRPSLRHDRDRPRVARGHRLGGLTDLLFVPGGYLRWLPSAIRAGRKIASDVDVILSVSNPITTHGVAWTLARASRRPWVAELRDPIVGYGYSSRGPERINRWIESGVVGRASGIVQWGDFIPAAIARRYPAAASKFLIIPHTGFDADDFVGYRHRAPADGPLTICYTGSFYGDTITPIPFLRALSSYLKRTDVTRVKAAFAGDWSPEYDRLIQQLGLGEHVRHLGRITRSECIRLWQRSHVLLLILGAGGDDVDRIPSKFWDYVAAGAVILALVAPRGRLAELIRSEGLGKAVSPDDESAIEQAIAELARDHFKGELRVAVGSDFLASASKERSERALSNFLFDFAGGSTSAIGESG